MLYSEYRQKAGYKKEYITKDQLGKHRPISSGANYQQLSEYDREAYKRLALLRKTAEKFNLKIQKVSKEEKFIAVHPDGLTKFFDTLDELEVFVHKFCAVQKNVTFEE